MEGISPLVLYISLKDTTMFELLYQNLKAPN